MSKYHAQKTVVDGITFDSKKEAKRYTELVIMERAGLITDLRLQVKYQLIPAQYGQVFDKKTRTWKRRCIERELSYIADFVYTDDTGKTVVEDTKGVRTKEYIIKRKLMLYFNGIHITEV